MRTVSRDEIVERGLAAAARGEETHSPWIYSAKVKSGRNATRNVSRQYYNIPHLMGDLVTRHAVEGEAFHVYGIQRVMKSHLRSQREDI
jgi:hypothetical protein